MQQDSRAGNGSRGRSDLSSAAAPEAVADLLLATKLRPLPTQPRLVSRPRLTDRLEPGGRRLTLVSAAAGFGKTTLLSTWMSEREARGRSVVWLSLDAGDNDLTRFLSYLVAAIRRGVGHDRFGESLLGAMRAPERPRVEALASAVVAELTGLVDGLDVVLDDYQVVTEAEVHRAVAFLLDHLPPEVHLVIASRVDPPLPLARLRAQGQLVRVGASDLAFTEEEARAFLRGVMELDLSGDEVASLEQKTEGWVAGLQLAALSMRDRSDRSGFVASFSGTHRHVLDFLTEEVLSRQPPDVRDFLLRTSVLDGLTGSLCDAVTGRSDGQRMLERLERENLFLLAADDERRWFRYHHLFAAFLRSRLAEEGAELTGEVHRRAADWYEARGHLAEAIGHTLAAADYGRAVQLFRAAAPSAWSRGEVPTVLRWLRSFPAEVRSSQPRLRLHEAMALALTGRSAEADLLAVEAGPTAPTTGEERVLAGIAAAVRSWCARLGGRTAEATEHARRALSLLPEDEGGLRAFAAVCLGDSLWTTGDLTAAGQALADAVAIGRAAGHVYATLSAQTLLVRVQIEQGRSEEAWSTLREAQEFLTARDLGAGPAAAAMHIATGALRYESDDLDGAEPALLTGVRLAELTGNVTDLTWGYVTLSRLRRARRDDQGALALAEQAERVAREYGADLEIAIATAWTVQLRLLRGELPETGPVGRGSAPGDGTVGAARLLDRITAARVLYASGRTREAGQLLDDLREAARTRGRSRDLVEILVLRALVESSATATRQAVSTMVDALTLADAEGYVRTLLDVGPPLAPLLSAVLQAQPASASDTRLRSAARYARRLSSLLERPDQATPPVGGLVESLTEREVEVLRLVAAGRTNREMAAELFVSVGTIKTHLNNLFRKLGAHSRTQALARARELGLLMGRPEPTGSNRGLR